ncbi:hypothetical protein CSB45_08450 [candidate division KSB3 bacterium]|uniref:Undecaprenyl-diphosphatase n=1 Tax=candidate division KSB3 bacterium TaxID=2044937 RepID=A0A2G6E597_9BACT|nr:MAG: hypothetical protein CSB45_08450 [candidate division KSB3 bacterium]PIE29752.1 MAG: hypothetical protein CSA57_06765 [candidate division KSB3 bacterium]
MRKIILAVIQGLTEFLPVSSSGHLALIQYFYKGLDDGDLVLDVLLHVGTLLVVLLYYRHDIFKLCRAALSFLPFVAQKTEAPVSEKAPSQNFLPEARHMILLIVIGSIPTALIGLLLKSIIEALFSSLVLVGIALVVTGTGLYVAEHIQGSSAAKSHISYRDALIIGTVQGIAICPGLSRSGSTISAAIVLGIDRKLAARFSFLLSIPAIGGALLLEGNNIIHLTSTAHGLSYAIAMLVAFITGYFAIHTLIKLVLRKKLSWFSWYCWGLGLLACIVGAIL